MTCPPVKGGGQILEPARTEDVAGVFVVEAVFVLGVLPEFKIALSQGLREAVFCFLDLLVKDSALGFELLEVIEVGGGHAFVNGEAVDFSGHGGRNQWLNG